MATNVVLNGGPGVPWVPKRPPRVLKANPVKDLHSIWYDPAHINKDIGRRKWWFKIKIHLELLMMLPTCYYVSKTNTPSACTCMCDPRPSQDTLRKAAKYLLDFATLAKDEQQSMLIQWIKYADNQQAILIGRSHKEQTRVYLLPGTTHRICRNACQRMVGYGSRAWGTCRKFAEDNVSPFNKHGLVGRKGVEANRSDGAMNGLMDVYFERMCHVGTPRATRQVRLLSGLLELRDSEDKLIELPSHMTKLHVYKRFVQEQGWLLKYDAKKRIIERLPMEGAEQLSYPSERLFIKHWQANFAHLVPQKARADVCGDCYIFANRHRYICKLINPSNKSGEEDEGDVAAEVDAAVDLDVEADTEKDQAGQGEQTHLCVQQEGLVMDAAKHVTMARAQRDFFRDKKEEAYLHRLQGKPMEERILTFVADYAQNVSVPHFAGEQPGDTYYYSPCSAYVFGIADCSTRPTKLTAHTYLEDVGKKGGNNVASRLWVELVSQGLVPTAATIATHKPVKELNLFFDNCGGQNKNRMVLRLLTFLVKRKVCKKARAVFLIRGHTKNDCDRIFNLMKQTYRNSNIYTPAQMMKAISLHEDVTAVEVTHFQDWNGLQDKYINKPNPGTVNCNHVFTVDADRDSNKLWLAEYEGADHVEEQLCVKMAYRDDDAWALIDPDDIEPPGLQYIKWAELFDKWKKFVPLHVWPLWKYYHVDLPEDKCKSMKSHKTDSKKKRTQRERVTKVPKKKKEYKPKTGPKDNKDYIAEAESKLI